MYELPTKSDASQVEVRLDLNIDELTERFVLPYRRRVTDNNKWKVIRG